MLRAATAGDWAHGLSATIALALACLLASPAQALESAPAPEPVKAVRVWPSNDYSRITIETAKPLEYAISLISEPNRVVLDLNNVEFDSLRAMFASRNFDQDPYIRMVRLGRFKPDVSRIVFDLRGQAKPVSFALKPVGQYQYRLVLDVHPVDPPDPLADLIHNGPVREPVTTPPVAPVRPAETLIAGANNPSPGGAITPPAAQSAIAANVAAIMPNSSARPVGATAAVRTGPESNANNGTGGKDTRRQEAGARETGSRDAIVRESAGGGPSAQAAVPATANTGITTANTSITTVNTGITNANSGVTTANASVTTAVPATNFAGGTTARAQGGLPRMVTIVVDAGHGGEDPGALGRRGSHEKDVTLSIARKVKAAIDQQPMMRAVLTRDSDYFIPLSERVDKARRAHADLFVSIHADSFDRPDASGSSVFALSERGATSLSARWLARKENNADLIGGAGFSSHDATLAQTLFDLSMAATISDSKKLAALVLRELGSVNHLHKPHVEQAGFAVLKSPDVPSILVETAFISNPGEERRLSDAAYQTKLATAIVSGVKLYFAKTPPLAQQNVAVNDR